jgi:hypothetical protein
VLNQNLAPVAKPLPGSVDVRPVWRERDRLGLKLSQDEESTVRIGLCQRLLDPFSQAFRFVRQRGSPVREPLQRRLPNAVQREDNANDARRVINHSFDER